MILDRIFASRRRHKKPSADVVFVCSSEVDEVWVRSTALACRARGMVVSLQICAERGPSADALTRLYDDADLDVGFEVSFSEAAKIDAGLAVTASSGLDRKIFETQAKYFVHMPHSLASLHMIYPPGTFDGYDVLFSAGPHHDLEFEALTGPLQDSNANVFPVGYGKLDLLQDALQQSVGQPADDDRREHVLFAPSWGPDNVLDRLGVPLVETLLAAGFRVTARPHPLFELEQAPVLSALSAIAGRCEAFELESPLHGDGAILTADVLIGDYSGISFEFSALRRRPVISVDVGRKEVNSRWREVGLAPIEIALRNDIGRVVPPDIDAIVVATTRALNGGPTDAATVSRFLHPGRCSQNAVSAMENLLADG